MTDQAHQAGAPAEPRLKHFPAAFFAMIMGLTGLSIAWHRAQDSFGIGVDVAAGIRWLAIALFLVLSVIFLAKLARYPGQVQKELRNPIQINFFPAISISMILLAIALLQGQPQLSQWLWMIGAAVHLGLTLFVLNAWMHHEHFEIHHINPAWFIPIVGNVLVPIAGVPLGYVEISWFFFSIGIIFWLVLLTIIFYRTLFHQPLPDRLMPTFFILIAPPAVGFIAYLQLTGILSGEAALDPMARVLFYSGLFMTLLLLTQIGRFARLQFFLSWWAYSFPIAAITIATLLMYQLTGSAAFAIIGILLLALVTLGVAFLLIRTGIAVARKGICLPHG